MSMEEAAVASTPVIAKAATATAYATVGSAVAFGLNANEIGVISSVIIGFLTFAAGRWIEYHFKQKHHLLEKERHDLLVQQWKTTGIADRREEGTCSRRDELCVGCPHAPPRG